MLRPELERSVKVPPSVSEVQLEVGQLLDLLVTRMCSAQMKLWHSCRLLESFFFVDGQAVVIGMTFWRCRINHDRLALRFLSKLGQAASSSKRESFGLNIL